MITVIDSKGRIKERSIVAGVQNNGDEVLIGASPEKYLEIALRSPRLPFGSINSESLFPEFQIDSVYGLNSAVVLPTTGNSANPLAANSASATGTNNLFTCSTGTTPYSFGVLQSRRRMRYRAGQGMIGRFTALWSAPVSNSIVIAGVGTAESGYYYGYNGTVFGILHTTGGVREIQTLTVTTASTAANNYNVTLAGSTYNVTATNNGSTIKTAYEISRGTFAGWTAVARGSTVVFLANSAGNKTGTFSLAQGGAGVPAAGGFVETLAGVNTTDTWHPQTEWNVDKLDGSGASGITLNPLLGNVFQIDIQYLGYGIITFRVEVVGENGRSDLIPVHVIEFPNSQTATNVTQPSFPFTMAAYSAGSSTNVSVSCASFAGFIEGKKKLTGPRMTPSVETNNFVGSAANTYYPLFTIRNDITHSHSGVTERANQSVVYPLSISCSHDDATPVTFYLIRNATLVGVPNFTRFDADSCIYWDVASTTCTITRNGQIQFALAIGQNAGGAFSFDDELSMQPGETLTLAARAVTGTATYVIAQLNTREDQ